MRKFLLFICALFALMIVCAPAFAQDTGQPDVAMGFGSFAALVAIIPFLTELFKKIPGIPSLVVQIISWLLGVILALIGWKFNLGFLEGLTWWVAALYGAGAGLVANGVFDTGVIDWILGIFGKNKE